MHNDKVEKEEEETHSPSSGNHHCNHESHACFSSIVLGSCLASSLQHSSWVSTSWILWFCRAFGAQRERKECILHDLRSYENCMLCIQQKLSGTDLTVSAEEGR